MVPDTVTLFASIFPETLTLPFESVTRSSSSACPILDPSITMSSIPTKALKKFSSIVILLNPVIDNSLSGTSALFVSASPTETPSKKLISSGDISTEPSPSEIPCTDLK